ncbi:MAG: DUF3341 domain-containing protein [Myxococcales bacterium]|nr:DUF3341 domain-containing protein [Myxococcales bacterium]
MRRLLVGYFGEERQVLAATRAVREAGLEVHDVYTPYAVHGMEEALGLRPTRLTWVCFGAGLFGLLFALFLQHYASAVSWPINVGGKPFHSLPAFIPVAFELTVLCAGLFTVAALFLRVRLFPTTGGTALPGVTDDRFALALIPEGPRFDEVEATSLLCRHGALETRLEEVAR